MKTLLLGLTLLASMSSLANTYPSFHSENNNKTYELGLNYANIETIEQFDGSIVSRINKPVFELKSSSETIQRKVHAIYFARNVFCKSLGLGEGFDTGSTLSDKYYEAKKMLTVGLNGKVSQRADNEPKRIYSSIDCINH